MRVFITGVTGFVGSHMAEFLLPMPGVETFGLFRPRSRMDNLDDLRRAGKLNFLGENGSFTSVAQMEKVVDAQFKAGFVNMVEGDMMDPYSMERVIGAVRPERIFHLAAQSYVPGSQSAPAATLQTNILGQLHIFEAVRHAQIAPMIHIAGSSEEYGLVHPEETPIKESNPLRPLSPYGVSKVTQEMLAYQYHRSFGLKTVTTRGFNHTGPRRGQWFVTSSRAKQIAEIERGLRPPVVYVGDMSSRRDWTDVRDMVRAYWAALDHATPGEAYNVGSGVDISVGEMQDMLLSMSSTKISIEVDPTRLRPSDVTLLLADTHKFHGATGWKPTIPFDKTLSDLLDWWRQRVQQ
ncbi:MAG: SDR family oxidoreductase [Dehalococcoidia bacterium]|nr:SDR family oxidoreductase [Dehalococcoidia bacterium]